MLGAASIPATSTLLPPDFLASAAEHVVGAEAEDDEIGLCFEPAEHPRHARLACGRGVSRDGATDHARRNAFRLQRLFQLGREAFAGLQLIPRHQRIAVGNDCTRFCKGRTRADKQQKSGNHGLDNARGIPIHTKHAPTGQSGSP